MSDNIFQSKAFKNNLHKYESARLSGDSFYLEPDELTDIAEYYHLHGRLDDALEAIDTAIEMFPGSTEPLAFKARAAILMGKDAAEAMRYANMIADKHDLDYYYIVAEIMIADGRMDDAESYLDEKEKIVDEDDLTDYYLDVSTLFADYDAFGLAQRWLDKCEDDDEDDYIELQARIALSKSDTATAKRLYNDLIDRDPYQVAYWNGLASAQYMASEINDSINSSDYALAIEPDNNDALLNRGNCFMVLGNYDDAMVSYKRYQQLQPNSEVADMGIAAIYMAKGELDDALHHWKEAERLCPARSNNRLDIYRNICLVYASMGLFGKAFEYIDKMRGTMVAKPAETLVLRGYIMLFADNVAEAKHFFALALDATPDDEKDNTLYFIAYCYFDCNYMLEAHRLFRRLTQSAHKFEFTDLWAYLVRTDYELGLQQEFLADLKKATEKSPFGTQRELADFFPSDLPIKQFCDYAANHPISKKKK